MTAVKKSRSPTIALFLILVLLVCLGLFMGKRLVFRQDFLISRPSHKDTCIFDAAHILKDITESTDRYLANIKKDYFIEMVIITLAALPQTIL
jgi:hypothetical protein